MGTPYLFLSSGIEFNRADLQDASWQSHLHLRLGPRRQPLHLQERCPARLPGRQPELQPPLGWQRRAGHLPEHFPAVSEQRLAGLRLREPPDTGHPGRWHPHLGRCLQWRRSARLEAGERGQDLLPLR